MPFNINGWEMAIIAILFLILFGPERLPEAASQLGKVVREIRKASAQATAEITRELEAAAREGGTSTDEIRAAGERARRLVADTSRAVSTAVNTPTTAVRDALTSAKEAAEKAGDASGDRPPPTAGDSPPAGAGSPTTAGNSPTTDAGSSSPGAESPDGGGGGAGTATAGAEPSSEPSIHSSGAEPIDVDMLARSIAPFDLDAGPEEDGA